MAEEDDVVAATSGTDSAIRTRKRPKFRRLMQQLGVLEYPGNLAIQIPAGVLTAESIAPRLKGTRPDGTEVSITELMREIEKLASSQNEITLYMIGGKRWLKIHTIVCSITFVIGLIVGNLDAIIPFVTNDPVPLFPSPF